MADIPFEIFSAPGALGSSLANLVASFQDRKRSDAEGRRKERQEERDTRFQEKRLGNQRAELQASKEHRLYMQQKAEADAKANAVHRAAQLKQKEAQDAYDNRRKGLQGIVDLGGAGAEEAAIELMNMQNLNDYSSMSEAELKAYILSRTDPTITDPTKLTGPAAYDYFLANQAKAELDRRRKDAAEVKTRAAVTQAAEAAKQGSGVGPNTHTIAGPDLSSALTNQVSSAIDNTSPDYVAPAIGTPNAGWPSGPMIQDQAMLEGTGDANAMRAFKQHFFGN